MQRIVHFIFVVITLSSFWTQAQTPTPPSTDRSGRVEEILVWKISEELKLAPQEEKKVSDLIRSLNAQKADKAQKIEDLQQKMSTGVSLSESNTLLHTSQKLLTEYNQISIEEIQKVQKILSAQQSVRYFAIKAGLSNKIRAILGYNTRSRGHSEANPANEKNPSLPEPKIIEDP